MTRFLRSILANLATLFLSFAVAVLIWITASQTNDPIRNQLMQVPVEFIGQPDGTILPEAGSVQVFLEGPASALAQLTADDFTATVNLSQVPIGEEVSADIQVRPNVQEVTILSQVPEQMTVTLERLVTRKIPVVLDIRGEVARGHTSGEPLKDPEYITVVGAESRVEPLDFARVTVFLNNDRQTVVESSQPIFYDAQGRVASISGLSLSTEQVQVTIPINETAGFAEKFIEPDIIGEPAPGYRLLSVDVKPPSVLIKGPPALVNSLSRVRTEPIDITGLTGPDTQQVTLALPSGITLDEVQAIFVDIEIEPFLTTSFYNVIPELQGLGEGLTATIDPEEVRVILFGPLPVLDSLLEDEVRATIDLFGLDVGVYSLETDVTFPDRGIEFRSVQPPVVTVSITRVVTLTNGITDTLPVTETLAVPTLKTFALGDGSQDNPWVGVLAAENPIAAAPSFSRRQYV